MIINALEYLEQSQEKYSDKVLYKDECRIITFGEALDKAKRIGTYLSEHTKIRKPILVLADKTVNTPLLYFAVLYSGCFYVPIGTELPEFRMNLIIDTVKPEIMVIDESCRLLAENLTFNGRIISMDEMVSSEIDEKKLDNIRGQMMDIDPAYVIFTSGSTGTPKGVVESHRQLIDYIEAFAETFEIEDNEIFGNQSPLDYIAAIRDLYLPLKTGASTVLTPKQFFSSPVELFEYLNGNRVTTICWVTGAFTICSEFDVFEEINLKYVKKIFFTGSVMPCKHLRVWQENIPDALYVNHYGPTEITASCTYYVVDHIVEETEVLPIGVPFKNTNILIINEAGEKARVGETGEIYVQGTSLALGYYNNPEKTAEVFVRNPLNHIYEETVYKTGDIGRVNDKGMIEFLGRKDSQIKHMGHRVELEEIQTIAKSMKDINDAVCLYNREKQQIWLYYTGNNVLPKELARYMKKRLPGFMIPRKYIGLEVMPQNFNGKVDMKKLREMME